MHAFDNGTSSAKKKANWQFLEKFFRKANIDIPIEMIDDVMASKEGAAAKLVERIYTILTKKP